MKRILLPGLEEETASKKKLEDGRQRSDEAGEDDTLHLVRPARSSGSRMVGLRGDRVRAGGDLNEAPPPGYPSGYPSVTPA